MILYGLLGIIVLIIIAAAFTTKDANRKAVAAGECLKRMEDKYERYIKENISDKTLEDFGLEVDAEQLSKSALSHIRSDLDGLINLINTNTFSVVNIAYSAQYFPNLIELTEAYFRTSQKSISKRLTEAEEHNLRNTALDAIQADVQKRMLNLNIGDL